MQECRWTSEPPLRLGSTYDQEAKFLGKAIVSSFEVIEFAKCVLANRKPTRGNLESARELMKMYEAFQNPPGQIIPIN